MDDVTNDPQLPDKVGGKTQLSVADLDHQTGEVPLCEVCRSIDFKRLLSSADPGSIPPIFIPKWTPCGHINAGDLQTSNSACPCCPLCLMFAKVAICRYRDKEGKDLPITGYEIQSKPYSVSGFGLDTGTLQLTIEATHNFDDHAIKKVIWKPQLDLAMAESKTGTIICRLSDHHNSDSNTPRILSAQLPPAQFGPEKASFYISYCRDSPHGLCRRPSGTVRNMRFIDCHDNRVVPAPGPDTQYVALSYRWPPSDQIPESSSALADLLSTDSCPPIIRDAILVTARLKFRYLWVDMFCIDQTSEADKQQQIGQMDLVYNCAELTIIAAGSNPSLGLRGVTVPRDPSKTLELPNGVTIFNTGPDPWSEVSSADWNTRAWTFQEGLLSRRRLIFTDHQAFFVCNERFLCESLGGPTPESPTTDKVIYHAGISEPNMVDRQGFTAMATLLTRHDSAPDTGSIALNTRAMIKNIETVYHLLQDYTVREMTHPSDAIRAFTGIFNFTLRTRGPVFNVSGLPVVLPEVKRDSEYVTRNKLFSLSVSWYHEDLCETPRRRAGDSENLFPSWSWAAWESKAGGIAFPWAKTREISGWTPFIGDFVLVKDDNSVNPPKMIPIEQLTPEGLLTENDHDSYRILQFSACVIAPSCFAFHDSKTWKGWSICGQPIVQGPPRGIETDPFGCPSEIFWEKINSGEFSCIALGAQVGSSVPGARTKALLWNFLIVSGDIERGAKRVGYLITGYHHTARRYQRVGNKLEESFWGASGEPGLRGLIHPRGGDVAEARCSCTAERWVEMKDRRTIRLV